MIAWKNRLALDRVVKSVRNRARLGATRLRGEATRHLSLGALRAGKRLQIGQSVRLIIYGELVLGDDVSLSDGCMLEVGPHGRLVIGNGVFVGRNSVIAAQDSVEIGDHVLIGEHCSIRDQDHHVDPDERLRETRSVAASVVVEANVWVCAGVRILRGCRIGSGAVLAANAVVRQDIPARMIAGGVPAKILGPTSARKQVSPRQ
jgi:acetyltransferase-like isoleucine patch superfamily enzyme